jgi:hypothetical protein
VIYEPSSEPSVLFQDLAAINALMRIEVERKSNVGKRLLTDGDDLSDPVPPKVQILTALPGQKVNTKLGQIIANRFQTE